MKIVKIIIQVVVGLMVVLAVIGWFLPSESFLYRETTINAPAERIHEVLNDMTKMSQWSPWHEIDPEGTKYVFEGPQSGVGSTMKWESDHKDVGTGSQKIIESSVPNKVKTEMYFGGSKDPAYATYTITSNGNSCLVKWDFEADFGSNPFMHYIPLMMESQLGPSYEKGLSNLKALIESMPEPVEEIPVLNDSTVVEKDSTMVGEQD